MSEVKQSRINLKRLKVAEFASEETLCFEATMLLDRLPIAQASNEGRGGMTFLRPIKGAEAKLAAAEAFAKELPALVSEYENPQDPTRKLELPMSLELLVDTLAGVEHENRRLRALFQRDYKRKVLFVVDNSLRYLKGVNLQKCRTIEIRRMHARIRAQPGPQTPILSELSESEAFALWKRLVVDPEARS